MKGYGQAGVCRAGADGGLDGEEGVGGRVGVDADGKGERQGAGVGGEGEIKVNVGGGGAEERRGGAGVGGRREDGGEAGERAEAAEGRCSVGSFWSCVSRPEERSLARVNGRWDKCFGGEG